MKKPRRSRPASRDDDPRSTCGFALFRRRHIDVANARWHELARAPARWSVDAGGERRRYRDLSALAGGELARLTKKRAATIMAVRADGGKTLRLELERLGRRTEALGLVLVEDVTAAGAHAAELARLQDALVQRERLSALGRLAGGILHDLGNTVGALLARLRVAALSEGKTARSHLQHMQAAVDNMRATLERLHRFTAHGAAVGGVDLRSAIEAAITLIAPALRRRGRPPVRLQSSIAAALPPVAGHAADLQSVFINLLLNAQEAMPRGGTIRVSARAARGRVLVTVRDQGTGVAPEHLPRLFEPFFTTKAAEGRAGLGLSIAYGIVHAANGTIAANNHRNGGLEITIALPVARRSRGAAVARSDPQ